MNSIGVFYERDSSDRRTASAGWYNSAAMHRFAAESGLYASGINGDAFSQEILDETLKRIRDELGAIDVFVYSLAAPTRTDPVTEETYRSAIKTVGEPVTTKTVDTSTDEVVEVTVHPASDNEIAGTVAVMGGADLERWVEALLAEDLLAPGAKVVSYSYIGSEMTWPIYRRGTIGRAKEDLEARSDALDEKLRSEIGGRCLVSMNPSVVTQAATAIPGVVLGMSILFKVMEERGVGESGVELMCRLFDDHIGPGAQPTTDSEGRIRLDDIELRPDIQDECLARWERIDTDNLIELSDYAGYKLLFSQLFGFDVDGIDYDLEVETDVQLNPAK
jgi:enoyl-[acyl-carrier protein] reductase/trans-2-enoyl-CoA reductase (NAD+)